jgi:hypothetical protein
MTYVGKIQNGVVVLPKGVSLPEGMQVIITPSEPSSPQEINAKPSSFGERMEELARWAESQPCDLPEDLAANHDHYIHGLPKRK